MTTTDAQTIKMIIRNLPHETVGIVHWITESSSGETRAMNKRDALLAVDSFTEVGDATGESFEFSYEQVLPPKRTTDE